MEWEELERNQTQSLYTHPSRGGSNTTAVWRL
ncbi:hypothetical protein CCACVL1_02239 [Corchorus capsularis]|uniref:Uncharacterized protein n=1 Tax=Corchorus capsularis TaxID=210143 RepID=A0A1R3KA04_COCAP|nr:hypothetical protein CCACVL1_02239 [Corchorus capsularis]